MYSRRRALQLLATAAACDVAPDAAPHRHRSADACVPAGDAPDIIFISIDDLNDWPTPFIGDKPTMVQTPNLARLASMGTVFQRAYCAAPMCGPSRSATMSGLPPHVSGVTQAENIFDPKVDEFGPLLVTPTTSLPRLLRGQGGYRTVGAGKIFHRFPRKKEQHNPTVGGPLEQDGYDANAWDSYLPVDNRPGVDDCPAKPPNDRPIHEHANACYEDFDFETSPLPDAIVGRYGVQRIMERADASLPGHDTPMFLGLGFFKPHLAWQAPRNFYDAYPLSSIKPPSPVRDMPGLTFSGCVTLRDSRNSPDAPRWGYDWDESTRLAIQGYLACITYIDELLGHILDAVENTNKPRETVIILWSDHGYFMGEQRGWKKPSLYERTTRIPLIIANTATSTPPLETNELVSLMDVFPTVLDYAHVADPIASGFSLRPLVEGCDTAWPRTSVVSTFNFQTDVTCSANGNLGNPDLKRCVEEFWSPIPITRTCVGPSRADHPPRFAGASSSLRRDKYRFIRYFDGSGGSPNGETLLTEELYFLDGAGDVEGENLLAGTDIDPEIIELANSMRAELEDELA